MESGGSLAGALVTPPRRHEELPVDEKRRRTESGAVASSTAPPRSKVVYGPDGFPVDGVTRAVLLHDCKHSDGSIYTVDYWSKVYCLGDTRETCVEPMMMTDTWTSCSPDWRACERHDSCTMMQIFSLKLPYTSVSLCGPVQLYGYMAVRDLLNPFRNYVFNRSRDDPFTVEQEDGFIQMSGPKRGIRMEGYVLLEYDMKIKMGGEERDDLQLIDGVAYFNNLTIMNASEHKQRIDGDCGAVDITLSLLRCAVEATVQVGISDLEHGSGLSLRLTASYISSRFALREGIRLADGVVDPETCELNKYVVAVPWKVKLGLKLQVSQIGGSDHSVIDKFFLCSPHKHGHQNLAFKLGLATVKVKVTWSTLDIPRSLLGPDCYMYDFEAARDLGLLNV
ncbi:uncharacterized protein [Lolium perenne]|uniref:uncharacterized protein n=1 Tax=Lolium perenne TaxID=4522 RepID=UPI0021F656C3|nr:uncharacterized protein LOC127325699 [Lolium perenne]XP_051208477.1 uncharacterized protein LOC127325706 [Lolium perenne]